MPVWIEGVPKDTGAADLEDSARLAGMMVAADIPYTGLPTPNMYLNANGELARWKGSSLPFTRDQLIPLALYYTRCSTEPYHSYVFFRDRMRQAANKFTAPNGKDFLAPHHRSHLNACIGGKWSLFGKAFLVGEILWQSFIEHGLSEPNQLICMLLTAGSKYVKMWKKVNVNWEESIRMYWCGWRQEEELAARLIERINSI